MVNPEHRVARTRGVFDTRHMGKCRDGRGGCGKRDGRGEKLLHIDHPVGLLLRGGTGRLADIIAGFILKPACAQNEAGNILEAEPCLQVREQERALTTHLA